MEENNGVIKSTKNIWAIMMLGALSMLFAEVAAGSSNLWFIELFGWLTTFVLYLTHVLFYFNLAIRTRKFSIWHMYMWGMLFALYEAPITQVLWAGYMDGTLSAFGLVGGIAIFEFITLVFFWHPIMSFILPVIFYEIIALENSGKIIPEHLPIIKRLKNKKKWVLLWFFIVCGNQAAAAGGNVMISFGAYLGSIILVKIFQKLAKRKAFGADTLILSNKGLIILILIVIFWDYGFITMIIAYMIPGRFPNTALPYVSLILIIAIILLMIKKSPEITRKNIGGESTIGAAESHRKIMPASIPKLLEQIQPVRNMQNADIQNNAMQNNDLQNNDMQNDEGLFGISDLNRVFLIQLIGVFLFSVAANIGFLMMLINVMLFPILGLILFTKLILTLNKLSG